MRNVHESGHVILQGPLVIKKDTWDPHLASCAPLAVAIFPLLSCYCDQGRPLVDASTFEPSGMTDCGYSAVRSKEE